MVILSKFHKWVGQSNALFPPYSIRKFLCPKIVCGWIRCLLGLQMEFLRSALEGSFWLSTYGEDYISAFSQQVQKIVMVPWKTLSLRTSLDLQLSYMMKKQLVVLTVSSQKANPIKKRNQLWVKIFSLFLPVSSLHAILFSCVKRES